MNYYFFGDDQSMYLIQRCDAGRLYWYSTTNPALTSAQKVINGPEQGGILAHPLLQCAHIFAGGDGFIYAVQLSNDLSKNGQLVRYQDTARNGTPGSLGAPQVIGSGWEGFTHLFSCGEGRIYGVNDLGELRYYKYNGSSFPIQNQLISFGWNMFVHIFSGGTRTTPSGKIEAVIYAIDTNGGLWWYKHLDADGGSYSWANNGIGLLIGAGWNRCTGAFSDGNGKIFATDLDGELRVSQVSGFWGDSSVDPPSAGTRNKLGGTAFKPSGFNPTVNTGSAIEGICWPMSVRPGETIEFRVSCAGGYTPQFLKLDINQNFTPMAVPGLTAATSAVQPRAIDVSKRGCGAWPVTHRVSIPSDWKSGIYVLKCTANAGQITYIPFTVKPAAGSESGKIALLVNINTWNAYNYYGGISNYDMVVNTVFDTPVRLSLERPYMGDTLLSDWKAVQRDHTLRAEWWILDWLQQNYAGKVDVYTDLDLHEGALDLSKYKVLVLSTHPEYWTDAMYDKTKSFLTSTETKGNLLYLGGNGVYRRCTYDAPTRTMMFLQDAYYGYPDGSRPAAAAGTGWQFANMANPERPESHLLGMGGWYGWAPEGNCLAYTVTSEGATDSLLAGTTGSTFGSRGNNTNLSADDGKAAGWETGTFLNASPAAPANVHIVARAGSDSAPKAEMGYFQAPGDGWVFSVGSITFGGSLYVDTNLQQVVKNMLTTKCGV